MSDPGFTLSRQVPAASVTTIRFDPGVSPTEFARRLARAPEIQDAVVASIRDALAGRTAAEVYDLVDEHDLDVLEERDVAGLLLGVARGERRRLWALLAALGSVGLGRRSEEGARLLPRLLALSDAVTPTVTVRLADAYEGRRKQRDAIAAQLAALAEGADVRVVGTGLALQRFAREHRHALPAGVHDGLNTRPVRPACSPLASGSTPRAHTQTLRALRSTASEAATYDALVDRLDVALDDVLGVFDAVDGPVILSADVADELGCSRETARRKLEQLHDRGDLGRRKVSRRVIYWDPDDTTAAGGVSDDGERSPTEADESRERGVSARGDEPQAGPPTDVLDAVGAADADPDAGTDGAAIPGDVDRDDAAAAVAAARDYIRDHGGATMQDLVMNTMPTHPLGYDVDAALATIDAGDRYRGGWWRNVVKPGLKSLDDVQTPPQGASTWRYTGEAPVDT